MIVVKCTQHQQARCVLDRDGNFVHAASYRPCNSSTFTVTEVRNVNRETAHAELVKLKLSQREP